MDFAGQDAATPELPVERLPQPPVRRERGHGPPATLGNADILASWGAALRSRAAGSQDESRCSAIHKQRPYRGSRVDVVAGGLLSPIEDWRSQGRHKFQG
jgi:hypothetical protein